MSEKWAGTPKHMSRVTETRERIREELPALERRTREGQRAEFMLRKLAKRSDTSVPEYAQIKTLESAGLVIRGKETSRAGVFNYRISPAGRAWLVEHPEGT